jgi:hypothetical protein
MKRFSQGLRQRRFAHAGHVFDQQMPPRQQGDQRQLDRFFLTIDGARDGALQLRYDLRGDRCHG